MMVNPKLNLVPLVGDKDGLYKFMVGDYRLLCAKDDDIFHVLVIKVKHRKEVYKHLFNFLFIRLYLSL